VRKACGFQLKRDPEEKAQGEKDGLEQGKGPIMTSPTSGIVVLNSTIEM